MQVCVIYRVCISLLLKTVVTLFSSSHFSVVSNQFNSKCRCHKVHELWTNLIQFCSHPIVSVLWNQWYYCYNGKDCLNGTCFERIYFELLCKSELFYHVKYILLMCVCVCVCVEGRRCENHHILRLYGRDVSGWKTHRPLELQRERRGLCWMCGQVSKHTHTHTHQFSVRSSV